MIVGSGKKFIFDTYKIDNKTLVLNYKCGVHNFKETITFPSFLNVDNPKIIRAVQLLHLIAGVSYYKAFVNDVDDMVVGYPISNDLAIFLNELYENGLGEFYYKNSLDPTLRARFSSDVDSCENIQDENSTGYLVGVGGGKDSLVALELLKKITKEPIALFGVNSDVYLDNQSNIAGITSVGVERNVDINALKKLQTQDGSAVPTGHIPISAILMSIGLIEGLQKNISYLVSGVEQSANEPTLKNYKGKDINHQYSKSLSYEKIFNHIISSWVGSGIKFFSILRPLTEINIMNIFITLGLQNKYKNNYSSCNRSLAFTSKNGSASWCGECQKCAFIFLLMSGASAYNEALEIFGKDLIAEEMHKETYEELLGLKTTKPFECVGEINESREAMKIAKNFTDAANNFEFPEPTESRVWNNEHNIPDNLSHELRELVRSLLPSGD